MEWSGLLVWWPEEWWLWRKYCYWCQATTAMRKVAATRPFTIHNDAGLDWVQLFFFFFRSSIVWWWKVNHVACVSSFYNDSQCIRLHWNLYFLLHFWPKTIFSFSYLMQLITSHFILWLLQTSCSIFIDVACFCYNHSRVFYACCTISMHITVILVVMLKIGNFNSEKFDVPQHIALK